MRLYSTHFHPQGSPRAGQPPVLVPLLVREGLSWSCLVFGWVGLLLSGAWVAALLAGAVALCLHAGLRHVHGGMLSGGWPILLGWHLLLACFGQDLRRWELGLRGFLPGPLVGGRDADTALVRLLDRQPAPIGERVGERA